MRCGKASSRGYEVLRILDEELLPAMRNEKPNLSFGGVEYMDCKICPKCKKEDKVVKILYGLPNSEGMRKIWNGECVSGGCCIDSLMPRFFCKRCKAKFGSINFKFSQ